MSAPHDAPGSGGEPPSPVRSAAGAAEAQRRRGAGHDFVHRVWLVVGIVALATAGAALLAAAPYVPLLVFTAVLGAVLLDGGAYPLREYLGLPRRVSVFAVVALVLGVLAGAVWIWGPKVSAQGAALMEGLPDAVEQVRRFLVDLGLGDGPVPSGDGEVKAESVAQAVQTAWAPVAGAFSTLFTAVTGVAVVCVVAFFLALQPQLYVGGLLFLATPERRARYREVLRDIGRALRWWLLGRFASMAVVGLLTVLGLVALGVPNAALLGLLAGLFSFIPFLGPLLSAAPAVLVGFAERPELGLWVALLYGAIQFAEGNFVTPLIQVRTVSLPPAVLIAAQLLMGVLFGFLGVLVATPLTVAGIVAVQTLYIGDVLGEHVPPMGKHEGREAATRAG